MLGGEIEYRRERRDDTRDTALAAWGGLQAAYRLLCCHTDGFDELQRDTLATARNAVEDAMAEVRAFVRQRDRLD
jgi:hypothetical protein